MHVLSIGEMLIDFLPGEVSGTYIRKAGGAPANVAIALARQGIQTSFLGLVGNDDFGTFLHQTLKDNNVEICLKEKTDAATTTMAFVSLDENGNRSFTFARKPGADMLLNCDMIENRFIDAADIVHGGSCSLSKQPEADATVYTLKTAHDKGKTVSFDVNYRDLMWDGNKEKAAEAILNILPYVDYLKVSDEEIDMIGGEKNIQSLMEEKDISIVVETLGKNGARCYFNGTIIAVDGISTKCIDSCGAGDAFWGGFLSGLIKDGVKEKNDITRETLLQSLNRANICGCLCVQKKGAIESLPTDDEVRLFLVKISD